MVHTGDTIATVMGWLSDTTAGGATTFYKTKVYHFCDSNDYTGFGCR